MSRRLHPLLPGVLSLALLPSASVARAQTPATPPAAPPAAIQPTATPPTAPAPVPNRLNEVLPAWLRVRGEFRERLEGVEGLGFTPDRDDAYALSRLRLQAAVTPSPWLAIQAQVQDARVARKDLGPTAAPFSGPFDLRLAFADVGSARAPLAVRVGRQELAFGEQRLLGHLAWTNTARAWDAARLTVRSRAVQVDTFAASLVRSRPDGFDRSGHGNRLVGAYASAPSLVRAAVVEPFVFVRRDTRLRSETGATGALRQTTAGVRIAGALPARWDYSTELAVQRGSLAGDSVRAWAGHWMVRQSLPGARKVRIASEYNFATGDHHPGDGVRQTFDQLYPTGHDKLGLADQVGWQNVHHGRAGVEFALFRATPLAVNYHSWWLADAADALYSAGGTLLARVPGGAAASHVGQELDVQITRALAPQLAVAGGYAHVFPGRFLRQATPGSSFSQPYVMLTYVFLAEK